MGSSDEDERKKQSINEMFGDDSDESDNEQIRPASSGPVTADASGLFGSDSESEEEQPKTIKKKKTAPPPAKRLKSSHKKSSGGSSGESRKRSSGGLPSTREKPKRRADSGDEYDSGDEVVRSKEDDDFIDKDDDLGDVLDEYEQDNQRFEDERPLPEKDVGGRTSKEDFFEETLKSLKTGRRNKLKLSAQEMEQVTQELLYQMDKAWADDQAAIADGKPALEKIKFVDRALHLMRKLQLQPMLLDFDLLSIVKKWISPLEDGTLPNLGVRTKMLQMMNRFPIYKEHLKRSGFGKVIMALWKHPEETRENKDLCREMIEKWSRSVFNKTLDFSKLSELEAEKIEHTPYRRPEMKKQNGAGSSRTESGSHLFKRQNDAVEAHKSDPSERARLPEQLRFDFLHRPQPKVDADTAVSKKMDPDSRKGRLFKRMADIAKPGKKGKRSVAMSIEGR